MDSDDGKSGTFHETEKSSVASAPSVSEDAAIWRAREHAAADDVDVYSTASAASVGLSVFETVTETHSNMTVADQDALTVASDQSDGDDS